MRDGDSAVSEQNLAVRHGVRFGPAADPAAAAPEDVGAGDLGHVQDAGAVWNGEIHRLAGLPGQLLHGWLHPLDDVEAAQRQRAKPDNLNPEAITLAVAAEEAGPFERRRQTRCGRLV